MKFPTLVICEETGNTGNKNDYDKKTRKEDRGNLLVLNLFFVLRKYPLAL